METTEPATVRVEVDGGGAGSAPTFSAYGHHYALVVVEGLRPDAASPYRVLLDDRHGLAAGRLAVPADGDPHPARRRPGPSRSG